MSLVNLDKRLKVLPHQNIIGGETRPLFFYHGLGLEIVDARIISFGACNFSCPYCKRNGNFQAPDGSIISSVDCALDDLCRVVDDALDKHQVVRLSGGDPVVFPEASLALAKRIKEKGGRLSLAHNGSSPSFVKKLIKFNLESAAIDLKAPRSDMSYRAGLKNGIGAKMYDRSIETQDLLLNSGVMVDIRTPIFSTTTLNDLLKMAKDIVKKNQSENRFWTFRLYGPVVGCDWKPPLDTESVIWMIRQVKREFPYLKMGLRAEWTPQGFFYFQ
ncbi:MAG: 7-carboxy-7-deazaguanine synthase [Syntrophomonadaceae bacterium]|nr:7-carboxy-7-deazaguanine synthase [Bacillota bacterium]